MHATPLAFFVGGGGVGEVLLLDGGEVEECVRERVGSAEGEDDAGVVWVVGDGDVTAGVGECDAGVPGLVEVRES